MADTDERKHALRIAAVGCVHGALDDVFNAVAEHEQHNGQKIDLLVCCGDIQAIRHDSDLESLAVPPKYKKPGDFPKYARGDQQVPLPVLAIGGNHEASDHMLELPYGGWLAPNVYFLGRAGCVWFGGVRFAGISGIYKAYDYSSGLWERPPCRSLRAGLKSAYHVRNFDTFRLKQVHEHVDVGLSHDWPSGVVHYGNKHDLYRRKKHLKADGESNNLGSPPASQLLHALRPPYWLSGHLHTRFYARVPHSSEASTVTHFYAIDKPGSKRTCIEVLDIPRSRIDSPIQFERDVEWLSIVRENHLFTPLSSQKCALPEDGQPACMRERVKKSRKSTETILSEHGYAIPPMESFDVHSSELKANVFGTNNPQTQFMHHMLGLQTLIYQDEAGKQHMSAAENPEEVDIT